MISQIRETYGEDLSEITQENAKEMAKNWIQDADLEGNSKISYEEFNEFFMKLLDDFNEKTLQ